MNSNNWERYKINEICRIRRGASPRPIQNFISENGIPWVKISDATASNSRFIDCTNEYIKEEGKEKSRFIEKGTLILSNSATPGIPKIIGIDACVHDGWLIIDEFKNVTKEFLYYSFINERERLINLSNGSVFRNLKTDIVKNYEINIPKINEQKAIVKILSDLDEKIEINNKINKTLEEIAQAIFKQWFVDFEFPNKEGKPYKSSDGEMVESELGMIPKGWKVKKVGDIIETVLGGTPSRKNIGYWENGTVAWVNSGKINEFRIIEPSEFITEEAVKKSSTKLLLKRTTVIAITGATLGQVSLLEIDSCTNQSVIGLKENRILKAEYIYCWMKEEIKYLANLQTGGAQQHINKDNLNMRNIIVPCKEILDKYYKIMIPIFDKISNSVFDIKNSSILRDTLLPKLMSGEIRVPLDN